MGKKHKLPVDAKRRWVLATLVHLPPAYLGLTSGTSSAEMMEATPIVFSSEKHSIDVKDYQSRLKTLWSSPYTTREEALQRTYLLQEELLYGGRSEHDQIAHLLSQYLMAMGMIERLQGGYPSALAFLRKAIALVKERTDKALEAKAYYLRAYTFFERWSITPDRANQREDLLAARDDCDAASMSLQAAKKAKTFVSLPVEIALLALSAEVQSHIVQDSRESHEVLTKVKQSETLLQHNEKIRDSLFFDIDEDWCQISKVQTLLGLGWPKSALKELTNLASGDPRKRRRFLTRDIVEAEAYILSGKVDIGIACAEHVLTIAQKVGSQEHIGCVAQLYDLLRRDDEYTRNPEVVRLGIQLLKVQHPDVFA